MGYKNYYNTFNRTRRRSGPKAAKHRGGRQAARDLKPASWINVFGSRRLPASLPSSGTEVRGLGAAPTGPLLQLAFLDCDVIARDRAGVKLAGSCDFSC